MASQRCCRPTVRGARPWSWSCTPCTQTLTVALALTLSTLHPNPNLNPNPTSLGTPRTTAAASTPHGTRGRPTSSCSPTRGCRARTITLTSSTSKSYLLTRAPAGGAHPRGVWPCLLLLHLLGRSFRYDSLVSVIPYGVTRLRYSIFLSGIFRALPTSPATLPPRTSKGIIGVRLPNFTPGMLLPVAEICLLQQPWSVHRCLTSWTSA